MRANWVATSVSVRYFRKSQARSGFLLPLEMPRPCELGVAQLPGICAAPSVSPLIHGPLPLIQKKAGAWACSMPTLPVANASLGSTQRPVQEIGLIAPLLVAAASLVTTSSAFAVLKVGVLRSFDRRSTPFIIMRGQ